MQTRAHDRSQFEATWPHVLSLVASAGARGAALVILPEGSVPAYVLGLEPVPQAQLDYALRTLGALAAGYRMTVVYGSARIVRDRTFNSAIVIGPDGRELGHASKQFLWHFDRRWFAAGTTLDPIDTPLGRIGVLICADGRIPTIAATLVERGAEILVMPTAWVTSGRDPSALENMQADLMANVRARENGVPFVVANKVGFEAHSVAYCGKSALIAADGSFVARANDHDETILFGEVVTRAAASPVEYVAARAARAARAEAGPHVAARARIAFTLAADPAEREQLTERARTADCDLLLPVAPPPEPGAYATVTKDGVRAAYVDSQAVYSPRGLVDARVSGIDLFVWEADGEPDWIVAFARTRAAELRAYVVVFDRARERAFVVDPDGVTLAGTFAGYRMASFVYDRARAAATLVAPATDVAVGLRDAEAIRAGGLASLAMD